MNGSTTSYITQNLSLTDMSVYKAVPPIQMSEIVNSSSSALFRPLLEERYYQKHTYMVKASNNSQTEGVQDMVIESGKEPGILAFGKATRSTGANSLTGGV